MLLSVCIPSYNRGYLLAAQVHSVLDELPASLQGLTEIVISDNHSSDATPTIMAAEFHNDPRVRIFRPEVHMHTAEENLCFALSQCVGEFIWTLGDDDAVEPETLKRLGDLLVANQHDFLIFNFRRLSHNGVLEEALSISCLNSSLEIPLIDYIRISGFWFSIAGFSHLVFRRSLADLDEFKEIISVGKIYSHVIWLIACFHNRRFSFVNLPLTRYRNNAYLTGNDGHWERVARREDTFVGGLWSTKFLKILDYLVAKGIFDRKFIREVVDISPVSRPGGRRFVLANSILSQFHMGLRSEVNTKNRALNPQDLDYFICWARALWPNNIVLLASLKELHSSFSQSGSLDPSIVAQISIIVNSTDALYWFESYHLFDVKGYAVYRHGTRWFAIRRDSINFVAPHLEFLDFAEASELFGVYSSESELLAWIAEQPPAPVSHPLMPINLRLVANMIRSRKDWRFHEWFRIVRALNSVFGRMLSGEVRRSRQRGRRKGNVWK